jgi:hypothetical protein
VGALSASPLAGWIGEIRLVVIAIAAAGVAIAAMSAAGSAPYLIVANFAYTWALVVASLVNRTQRQRIVPRAMLGRVTSGVRALFLAVDPLGVVIAGTATSALGGDPAPGVPGGGGGRRHGGGGRLAGRSPPGGAVTAVASGMGAACGACAARAWRRA